jgi:hypothetical protein
MQHRTETEVPGGQNLPRVSGSKRARFFEDPCANPLFGISTALAAELPVLAERERLLERVLQVLEAYTPGD